MKKLVRLISPLIYLLSFSKVVAQEETIKIIRPKGGFAKIGDFITNLLTILVAIGAIVLLLMIVWGAYEWITSGGDKEAISRARGRITAAFIGLAVLGVAFALAVAASRFFGVNLTNIIIPTPPPYGTPPT